MPDGDPATREPSLESPLVEGPRERVEEVLAGKFYLTLPVKGASPIQVIADVGYNSQTSMYLASWHGAARGTVRQSYTPEQLRNLSPRAFNERKSI